MPAKGSYSHIIEPPQYVDPIDINLYYKGQMQKENIAEKQLQLIGNQLNTVANIPAFGVDAEHLNQKMQKLKEDFSVLNMSNLNDVNTNAQINGLINSFKSDPEINAIAKRGFFYQNEMKKKQEAEEKGNPYYSSGMEELENYYNGSDFIEKPNVNLSQGFVGADVNKLIQDGLKNVATEEVWENGYSVIRPKKGAVEGVISNVLSDPRIQKQMYYGLDKKYKNKNWEQDAYNDISEMVSLSQEAYNQALQSGDIIKAQQELENYTKYQSWLQDPTAYASKLKQDVYSSEINDWASKQAEQNKFNKIDAVNQYALEKMKYQNDRDLELFKLQNESGISLSKYPNDVEGFRTAAAKAIQENKLKNAQASNPNYKITSSDAILDYTEKNWADNVFVENNGVTKIPDKPGAKTMIKKLILADPNKFPEIPQEVIETLQNDPNADIIDIVNGDIEIDPSFWNPTSPKYVIKAVDALQRKNQIMKPKDGSTQSTSGASSENKLSPIKGFEATQYTVGNDTITAPIITNLSDTSKLEKGAYFSYNGELYKN